MRQCTKVKNMSLLIHNTNGTGTEYAGLFDQSTSHNTVGSQQIVNRIWIKFVHVLVNLVGILDLCYIFRRRQDLFAVDNRRYLFCYCSQGYKLTLPLFVGSGRWKPPAPFIFLALCQ